jgi:hypothetical protein
MLGLVSSAYTTIRLGGGLVHDDRSSQLEGWHLVE